MVARQNRSIERRAKALWGPQQESRRIRSIIYNNLLYFCGKIILI